LGRKRGDLEGVIGWVISKLKNWALSLPNQLQCLMYQKGPLSVFFVDEYVYMCAVQELSTLKTSVLGKNLIVFIPTFYF